MKLAAEQRLMRCDGYMTPPHKHGLTASPPVYRTNGSSCYFRWSPLLWTGQNLHMTSAAYRKSSSSWRPEALLNYNWLQEAVIHLEDKLTVLFNKAFITQKYQVFIIPAWIDYRTSKEHLKLKIIHCFKRVGERTTSIPECQEPTQSTVPGRLLCGRTRFISC